MARNTTSPEPEEIELEVLSRDTASTSSSSSSTEMSTKSGGKQMENPWNVGRIIPGFPAMNWAANHFSESASSVGRGLSSLLDDASKIETLEEKQNISVYSSSSSSSLSSSSSSTLTSPSSSPLKDGLPIVPHSAIRDLDLSVIHNFTLEKATTILNSTSTALAQCRERLFGVPPLLLQGVLDRVHTTLRGSADDIGWLRKVSGPVHLKDQTQRFEQILGLVRNGAHLLPDNLVYLLVPGLFSKYGPLYFVDAKNYFSKLGLTCHIAKIHSEAAVETNASVLKDYIEELYWGSGKQVAILGHSKGGVDAAAAIAMNWEELKNKVAGLVLVQSPYGGSPIASDILREGQIADIQTRYILELLMQKMVKGDIRALEDLTYSKRKSFLAKNPLPNDFPVVSFHTEVSLVPSILSMMTHIAHAELPWNIFSSKTSVENAVSSTKLPVVIPLPAVMCLCAKHIELRYNHKSDGLVVREDAEAPGSVVVRPDRKLDHAWMVYSSSRKDTNEPDAPEMCEALITLLLEACKRTKSE